MGPFGTGLHDELVRARQRDFEAEACRGFLASKARESHEEAAERAERRSAGEWLAGALRSAADRLDRPAADCR